VSWPSFTGHQRRVPGALSETVLVITDRVLYPPRAGNRTRIIALTRGLRSLGFRVVLVVRRPPGWRSRIRTWLLAPRVYFVDGSSFGAGSPQRHDSSPYWGAVIDAVRRERPAVVIAEYIWMAPCLDRVDSGALKLMDTHDLMHVRRERYAAEGSGAWVECSAEEEAALLLKADAIIAIHRSEKAKFAALVPERAVITLPHPQRVKFRGGRSHKSSEGRVVMFVGSSNRGNVAGLRSFLADGWSIVRESHPGAELRIYGDSGRQIGSAPLGVRAIGYVRRLARAYRAADVVINPVTLGTGLKIKTVEALAWGKAVVTTPCGAEGLESGAGVAFLVAADMQQLAGEVVRLLQDPARRQSLERSAIEWARTEFAPEAVFREFLDLLRARGVGAD
jgi:glycosyltransferase involved in cell wall biosynthesis